MAISIDYTITCNPASNCSNSPRVRPKFQTRLETIGLAPRPHAWHTRMVGILKVSDTPLARRPNNIRRQNPVCGCIFSQRLRKYYAE